MDIQGYFTNKGLALSAKLAAGSTLTITKVVAGAGQTANPMAATSLPQPKQMLAVNTPTCSGSTAVVPATLVAAHASADYTLTELGVYASDPDEGEILYKLYRLGEPVAISPASRLVLRFYLEETVSQDLNVTVSCSPAGLITETDFSEVQKIVLNSVIPSRSVTVPASDLPGYIAALPRLRSENLTIFVTGTVTEPISLIGFYGCGGIFIVAHSLGECTVKNVVSVGDCSVRIGLQNLAFVDSGEAAKTSYRAVVFGINARQLAVDGCSFTGNGTGRAILITNGSSGWVTASTIQNFADAVCPWGWSKLGVGAVTASENVTGIHIYGGGIAMLWNTPELVGGSANYNDGGLIVQNGNLL